MPGDYALHLGKIIKVEFCCDIKFKNHQPDQIWTGYSYKKKGVTKNSHFVFMELKTFFFFFIRLYIYNITILLMKQSRKRKKSCKQQEWTKQVGQNHEVLCLLFALVTFSVLTAISKIDNKKNPESSTHKITTSIFTI